MNTKIDGMRISFKSLHYPSQSQGYHCYTIQGTSSYQKQYGEELKNNFNDFMTMYFIKTNDSALSMLTIAHNCNCSVLLKYTYNFNPILLEISISNECSLL